MEEKWDNSLSRSEERIMGWADFMWLWLSMTAQMGIFLLGSSLTGRISFWDALAAIVLANVFVLVVLIMNGDIGTKYGIHFSLYLKAPFGYKGRVIPSLMRAATGIFWFGIQTYYGALAINIAVEYLVGYSNWMLWYAIFGIVQIYVTAGGISWIRTLSNVAAPTLLALSAWLIYRLAGGDFASFLNQQITNPIPFFTVVTACLSYWVTVAVNISDFTRYMRVPEPNGTLIKRNWLGILGQLPGIMIGMIVFTSVGMIGNYYTGHGNPVEMISSTLGGGFMLVGLIIVLLAQISTNITANLYAPGNILSEIFADNISFKKAVWISGLLGLFTLPWLLLEYFLVYLPLVGAFLAPLPGIMIVDYLVIRRGKLEVRDFVGDVEKFQYWHGYNLAALIAYVVSGVVGMVFLQFSWFFSLPTAAIVYYFLMRNGRVGMERSKESI